MICVSVLAGAGASDDGFAAGNGVGVAGGTSLEGTSDGVDAQWARTWPSTAGFVAGVDSSDCLRSFRLLSFFFFSGCFWVEGPLEGVVLCLFALGAGFGEPSD